MALAVSGRNMMPMPKCADCGEPIPMEQMMDHVCKPRPPPSPRYASSEPPEPRPSRYPPQRYDDDDNRRPPLPQQQQLRYRPSSPSRSEPGRVRQTPARNPPPPNIRIPQPQSAPVSPEQRRAPSIRSMGSQRSINGGLPSGPRRPSLEDNRYRGPPPPSAPVGQPPMNNESVSPMRHRPTRSREEESRYAPFNANANSNGPKSADALLYNSQRGPPAPFGGSDNRSIRSAREPMPPPPPLPTNGGGPVNMAGVGRRGFAAAANAVMAAQEVERMRRNANSGSPRDRIPLPPSPLQPGGRRPSIERERRSPMDDRRTPPPPSALQAGRRPSIERERPSLVEEQPRSYRQAPINERRTPPNLSDRRTPPSELRRMNNNDDNGYLSTGPSSSSGPSSGSGYSMGASTPPLSPALSSPSSPSLHSPISPSPVPDIPLAPSRTPSNGSARSKLRELREMRDGPITPAKKSPPLPLAPEKVSSPTLASGDEPVSLLERYRNMAGKLFGSSLVTAKKDDLPAPPEESRKSEELKIKLDEDLNDEETMLAYGRDSVVTDSVVDASEDEGGRIAFPASTSSVSSSPILNPTKPLTIVSRTASSSSMYSTASRFPSKSAGAQEIERPLDTLLETSEPNTPLPQTPRTPPSLARARSKSVPRRHGRSESDSKVKFCVKCDKRIDDGRWVRNEGGGVLCEGCWKNLYLPRCRRCDLPIEKGAVSSSDGQLKGKYHKGCFTCYTCQDPFPTKSFYVFENNPYCSYHYHLVNNSLCASSSCGQPIEGPCAVAHNGDRYHPECLTCEWRGRGGCKRSLDEYWEVDGERFCDYHARKMENAGKEERSESRERTTPSRRQENSTGTMSRAQKRVTRYISLAGLSNAGGSDTAAATATAGGGGGLDGLRKKLNNTEETARGPALTSGGVGLGRRPSRPQLRDQRERGRFL